MLFFVLFPDTMVDFAADLSKIVSEKKLTGGAGNWAEEEEARYQE